MGRGDARRWGRIVAIAVLCAAGLLIPQSAIAGGGRDVSLGSCQSGDVVITIFDYGFNPDSQTISSG